MSINANTLYYNMRNSSSSSSSGENSYSVLIKKAMAKMPVSLNTKKSIDEYYKTAMEKINLKMKAAEKAKKAAEAAEKFIAKAKMAAEKAAEKARKAVAKPKAVKGSKTAKKPRAKKVVGGMTDEEELKIIDNIFTKFISYNNRIMTEGSKYINHDTDSYRSDIKGICDELNKLFHGNITISDEEITRSLGSDIYVTEIYDFLDGMVTNLLQDFIYKNYRSKYDYYVDKYNNKRTNNTYWD